MSKKINLHGYADLIQVSINPNEYLDFRYLGLEHIEQQSLRLNGSGLGKDAESNKFLFKKGDILFGKLRPYFRKVIKAPYDGICSTDIWVLRAKNNNDSDFLFYLVASQDFINQATQTSEGTKMPRAKWEVLKNYEILVTNTKTQKEIGSILSTIDNKIINLIETNQTLESIAQAIFKSWFIDFGPVHAKQQGIECAGIDKATADLFPNSFVKSELGLIPKGWTIKQLKDIAVRHVEKIKNVVDWENEYLIDLSRIDSKNLFNINYGYGKELTTSVTKFVKGDILFGAIRPYFHKVTLANLNGVTNISVFVIRPSVDFYHEYLASLMFRESTVDFSVRLSKGTKMPVISWSDLSTLKITLAPESIIKKYSELISPLMKKGIENSALIN